MAGGVGASNTAGQTNAAAKAIKPATKISGPEILSDEQKQQAASLTGGYNVGTQSKLAGSTQIGQAVVRATSRVADLSRRALTTILPNTGTPNGRPGPVTVPNTDQLNKKTFGNSAGVPTFDGAMNNAAAQQAIMGAFNPMSALGGGTGMMNPNAFGLGALGGQQNQNPNSNKGNQESSNNQGGGSSTPNTTTPTQPTTPTPSTTEKEEKDAQEFVNGLGDEKETIKEAIKETYREDYSGAELKKINDFYALPPAIQTKVQEILNKSEEKK